MKKSSAKLQVHFRNSSSSYIYPYENWRISVYPERFQTTPFLSWITVRDRGRWRWWKFLSYFHRVWSTRGRKKSDCRLERSLWCMRKRNVRASPFQRFSISMKVYTRKNLTRCVMRAPVMERQSSYSLFFFYFSFQCNSCWLTRYVRIFEHFSTAPDVPPPRAII